MSEEQVVRSPLTGVVSAISVAPGDHVAEGRVLLYIESMKMEHAVKAPGDALVAEIRVEVGDQVNAGDVVVRLSEGRGEQDQGSTVEDTDDAQHHRLDEVRARHAMLADAARPEAVARRRATNQRTARENVEDLLDAGSFVEYGGLAIAAQRRRKSVEELQATTPADGLVTGVGTVDGAPVAVAAYDATVLAGTQGHVNHLKKDRLFELALRQQLPVVLFAEGGGGRPGDVDVVGASWLEVPAFHLYAQLSGLVPTVAIVAGKCFAGNAALAGCADVLIATEDANLGMAGPAMIEGGGLGRFAPEDIGRVSPLHVQNGVVDVVVADEAEAVAVARQYLGFFQRRTTNAHECADQELLRDAVPEDRRRAYDVRALLHLLADTGSVLELRRGYGPGILTALARIEGRAMGVLANDPAHLGGAIDALSAEKAARFLELCDAHDLPVLVLCDTPGFMVGPEAEADAGVRRFGRLFVVGANLQVPLVAVVTRKAYGLGAMAMLGGHLKVPVLTVAWPTGELGPMGLEGAVRLGFRRELEAVEDPTERAALEDEMITQAYAQAGALNVATFAEIDDVIDPADTRARITAALALHPPTPPRTGKRRPQVSSW